jgi:hypothetical protein
MKTPITIEQLEALATQIENDNDTEHARLSRLCRAMVRILAARQPELFTRHATSVTDEAGHWDNSYPPNSERHYGRGAPRLLMIRDNETSDVPTSSGYYHDWRRQTDELGLWIARDGTWYGCDETGTGAVGPYAAHPGDCQRDITLDWIEVTPTLADLRQAEPILRAKLGEFLAGEAA